MKLRSGNYKTTNAVQNQITLRGGRKINVPRKDSHNKKRQHLVASKEKIQQPVRNGPIKKLWPFTADTIAILRSIDIAVPVRTGPHDDFVKFYQQKQAPVTFSAQFIPSYNGDQLVCSGQLRICHTKKNLRDLTEIFMTSWGKFERLLMPEIKKIKLAKTGQEKYKKKIILPRAGFLMGLCYNMLLTRDDSPDFRRIWHGHANVSSTSTHEHSIIEPIHIPNSSQAYDFISNISQMPHLQMANHWYQNRFEDSEERVYSVLDLVFTFQQFISEPIIIQSMQHMSRRVLKLD